MYSHQLLRVNHDELLRSAETRRLVKQARDSARPGRRERPERVAFGALALRRPLRHA